ncbi:hypothetical protein GOP47_0014952 [Adiantum capillus-veneris]|uniref:Uncharacterized protein n=1 Tax=Adiantum capillus-veneris TaxID=13818 RepID=A0A9D4UMH3_ADICA|nr:hypothetical protein GOP47_0014952 [Adiantum capillus-veneris]
MRQLTRGQRENEYKHREAISTDTMMCKHVLIPTCIINGSRPGGSNLDCILEYTTPSVICQYQPKSGISETVGEQWKSHGESIPFFSLGDLWHSFDEWSAYGAGVPLKLPGGETIVQYYVPYLSALQIYMPLGSGVFATNKRRLGDESDWSDASDMRDNSSDFGSDNENEKVLTRLQGRAEQWESSSSISSASSEQGDRHGELTFEYFERCSPYGRAPLAGKISELANRFPSLLSLRSNEVSPASWLSVAWYPIYRIPMGPTMSDLSTCFLTYHALWTPPYPQDFGVEGRVKAGASHPSVEAPRQHESDYACSSISDFCSCKLEQEQWLRENLAWRFKSGTLELPAFGLASYKLRGPFWASAAPTDKERILGLAKSADSWLKQLRVQHPDYEFFSSREAMKFDRGDFDDYAKHLLKSYGEMFWFIVLVNAGK